MSFEKNEPKAFISQETKAILFQLNHDSVLNLNDPKLFGSQIIKEKFLVEQPHWKYEQLIQKKQGQFYSEIIITRTTILITSWFCHRWKLFQANYGFIWIT